VGLGGRLDATNVLRPLVSVITRLSLDHTALLGDTLAAIAAEKGGIIKPGVPLVSAPQAAEAAEVLTRMAAEHHAPLTLIGRDWTVRSTLQPGRRPRQMITVTGAPAGSLLPLDTALPLALTGAHQVENAAVAAAALTLAATDLPRLTGAAVAAGFARLSWPGRLQPLNPDAADEPLIVVDSAHNGESAQRLQEALRAAFAPRRLWFVFGAGLDKDYRGMLAALLPGAAGCVVTRASHPRAAATALLQATAVDLGLPRPRAAQDVGAAVSQLWPAATAADVICITGSIFLVAEALAVPLRPSH
jgi:dihydrofolate synthase/folylpolyglutamate synthase